MTAKTGREFHPKHAGIRQRFNGRRRQGAAGIVDWRLTRKDF
jgi:hypothetical protein